MPSPFAAVLLGVTGLDKVKNLPERWRVARLKTVTVLRLRLWRIKRAYAQLRYDELCAAKRLYDTMVGGYTEDECSAVKDLTEIEYACIRVERDKLAKQIEHVKMALLSPFDLHHAVYIYD